MITFQKDCFELRGGGNEFQSEHFAYFSKQLDAESLTKGIGAWGSNGSVHPKKIDIRIFESVDEYTGNNEHSKKLAALAKLTDEEKKLLGL